MYDLYGMGNVYSFYVVDFFVYQSFRFTLMFTQVLTVFCFYLMSSSIWQDGKSMPSSRVENCDLRQDSDVDLLDPAH